MTVFGAKRVAELTETDVSELLRGMTREGLTQRSAAFTLFVVESVLNHAVARKLLPGNPATTETVEGLKDADPL